MTQEQFIALLGDLSVQMRGNLSNFHLVTQGLITTKMREEDSRVDQKAAVMDQSYYQLLRLAENLSDAEYMASDKILPCQMTDLVTFVGDVCEKSQSAVWETGCKVVFRCKTATLPWGVNRKGLERALYHLVSNGLKYTKGDVTITLEQVGKTATITVSDTGNGLSAENIERALTLGEFIDVYTDLKRGFGLGLPISCAIARRHGGGLTIHSQEGQGTHVTITLPKVDNARLGLSDIPSGYESTFNPILVRLADALPREAFGIRTQD